LFLDASRVGLCDAQPYTRVVVKALGTMMADIFIIESGVSSGKNYFDGSQWSSSRAEAYEFETRFDALQAQDYYRLEEGEVVDDMPYSHAAGLYR
jgi:hypothetical protein